MYGNCVKKYHISYCKLKSSEKMKHFPWCLLFHSCISFSRCWQVSLLCHEKFQVHSEHIQVSICSVKICSPLNQRQEPTAKESVGKDTGVLEGLNKGWNGAHLSVQREHEFGFAKFHFIMILECFTEKNMMCVDRVSHYRRFS